MKKISTANKYYISQAFYWMIISATFGYATVYLQNKSFSFTEIGMIIALANILASIIQPISASYADKKNSIGPKPLVILLSILPTILLVVFLFDRMSKAFINISYILILTFSMSVQPLLNAITIHLNNSGHSDVDFGVSRAIGSFTYAIVSLLLGQLIKSYGVNSMVWIALISYMIFLFFLYSTPIYKEKNIVVDDNLATDKFSINKTISFIKKYKYFFLLILSTFMTFTFYNMINAFWIKVVESVGGSEGDLGIVIAIGAFSEIPVLMKYNRIADRYPKEKLLIFSSFIFIIRGFIIIISKNIYFLYLLQLTQSISFALYLPSIVYYTNDVIEEKDMVKGQALVASALTLAGVLGSFLGGVLIDFIGIKATVAYTLFIPILGSILLIYSIRKINQEKNQG